MKPRWQFLPGVALCIALTVTMSSQSPSQPVPRDASAASRDDIRRELNRLLVADSMLNARPAPADAAAAAPDRSVSEAFVMSPYVVKGARIPNVKEAVFEPPLMRFLRDGTLYENFGRKFTTKMRLRFYSTDAAPDNPAPAMFGNVRPRNGAQLGLSWSW